MSEYKGIQGFTVQSLASDPSPLLNGQMWYNSTSKTLKVSAAIGTWATGNNMNTARQALAGTGTQTAALAFGGSPTTAVTEKYDGTNWTTVNSMNTARTAAGAGTQTAALAFGGTIPGSPLPTQTAATEKYDGTNWTTVNSLNTGRTSLEGTGTQTAALAFGGTIPPVVSAATEEWTIPATTAFTVTIS